MEHETSKTLFYVVGSALAVAAVLLSAVGLTRPAFPSTPGAKRALMVVWALIVAATMAAAVITA